ncbi:MAG: hypothetical protein EB059_10400 [Alphaproteobacteria bacterium]|nr:hypothetical protein [Alphaproteobacteria bacterium]
MLTVTIRKMEPSEREAMFSAMFACYMRSIILSDQPNDKYFLMECSKTFTNTTLEAEDKLRKHLVHPHTHILVAEGAKDASLWGFITYDLPAHQNRNHIFDLQYQPGTVGEIGTYFSVAKAPTPRKALGAGQLLIKQSLEQLPLILPNLGWICYPHHTQSTPDVFYMRDMLAFPESTVEVTQGNHCIISKDAMEQALLLRQKIGLPSTPHRPRLKKAGRRRTHALA